MSKINDGAPYPVDGQVELKYRLLALTVYGVGVALGLSIVVGVLLAAARIIGGDMRALFEWLAIAAAILAPFALIALAAWLIGG